jgi:RNA polymerase-binding transcription factor DksA
MMTQHNALAARLRLRLTELTGEIETVEAQRRTPLDADFAEQARQLAGQDALSGIEDAKMHEANEVRAALNRIKDGGYGLCSKCGDAINPARLEALPTAITCIKCAD